MAIYDELTNKFTLRGWKVIKIPLTGAPSIFKLLEASKDQKNILLHPKKSSQSPFQADRDEIVDLREFAKKKNIPAYFAVLFSKSWVIKHIDNINAGLIFREDSGDIQI